MVLLSLTRYQPLCSGECSAMPNPAPANPAADRNLLFGIFAVQMDFVSRDALIAAMNAWVLAKHRPLGDLLQEQGALSPEHRQLLEQLTAAHLKAHGGDVQQSLAVLKQQSTIGVALGSVADGELQASLAVIGATLATTDDHAPPPDGMRYRVLRPHAQGGLGVVSVARDTELGREVALKEIHAGHAGDAVSRDRFVREAEITGGLEHPGIVPVYGLGRYDDGRPYYAMRFIRGESLQEAIKKLHMHQAGYSQRGLLTRFVAACNAIAYAHSRGVIHRDIKPSNVMLGPYGETLVVDWGLAKVIGRESPDGEDSASAELTLRPPSGDSSATQAGSALGTPAFMSPEQARGELAKLGPATDIYSLGATLYTLITGRPPIQGRTTAELLENVRLGNWKPARQLQPSAPKPLDAVASKALALKPADRYATPLELAAEVERWLADEPVHAYREPWRTKAGRWLKRHRLPVTGAVVLLLAAVPLLVIIAVNRESARSQAAALATEADQQREIADQARDEAEKRRDQVAAVNDTLRRANYIADMNLAQHAWEENNLVRTRQLLDQHRPKPGEDDLRGFEWHYLNRLFHRDQLTIHAHVGHAANAVFSPDGKRLFSCGKVRALLGMQRSREVPSEIKLWDAATGRQLDLALDGSTDPVRQIALSPDGTYLGAACLPGGIRVWNLATHQRFDLKPPTDRLTMAVGFSPDSKRLVAWFASLDSAEHHEDVVRVYDLSTHDPVWTLESLSFLPRNYEPAFSPDGKYVAIPHIFEGRVRVVEAATGREAFSCKYGEATVSNATFSPDGKSLAIGGSSGVTIWDVATHQQRLTCQNTAPAGSCLGYSPDGKQLAMSRGGGVIGLWDARTGQQTGTFKGHAGSVYSITFRPDGRYLASAGDDGTVRVWDTTSRGDIIPLFKELKRPYLLHFSPDGHALLVVDIGASDLNDVFVVDATTGQRRAVIHLDLASESIFDWAADGKHLIGWGEGKTIRIYDTGTGALVHSFPVEREEMCFTVMSPDGRWFAHSAPAATIKVRDAETGAERRAIRSLSDEMRNLAFDPDGSHLAGTDTKGWLRVWDVATGGECLSVQFQDMRWLRLRFSSDGKRLAIFGANTRTTGDARILDAATGREILKLAGHTSNISDVTFSPDGQRLATASWDQTIRIWDAQTGQEILTLRGHTQDVSSVRFVSGGHRLLSASHDRTIRVWDATPLPQ
jgi:WD40 repeat protein/tRNA A-37 threonylcarbamoyl transferase component Bud32